MKCIVFGCTNDSEKGFFVVDICRPCHEHITTGDVGPTTSFIGKMKVRLDFLEDLIKKYESDE